MTQCDATIDTGNGLKLRAGDKRLKARTRKEDREREAERWREVRSSRWGMGESLSEIDGK